MKAPLFHRGLLVLVADAPSWRPKPLPDDFQPDVEALNHQYSHTSRVVLQADASPRRDVSQLWEDVYHADEGTLARPGAGPCAQHAAHALQMTEWQETLALTWLLQARQR